MSNKKVEPFISADQKMPEITLKVILISVFLVILLCASNAYLGLKVGQTISASIPAAILGMGLLRLFKNANVLENTMIQTCASASEALVAGVAFVLPALVIMHFWEGFHYWQTLLLSLFGGVLGMLCSIPIRRVMLEDPTLRFPEGTAIGSVLKVSLGANTDMKPLIKGGIVGALITLFQTGFRVLSDQWALWTIKNGAVWGIILGFSPAMIAAGYIIGIQATIAMTIGIIINFFASFPILSAHYITQNHTTDIMQITSSVWGNGVRYLGIGTMLIGGVWTILTLLKPIYIGIRTSFSAFDKFKETSNKIIRTERDIPMKYVLILIAIVGILAAFLFYNITSPKFLAVNNELHIILTVVAVAFVLVGGFLFASIASYFAGLIGSTNNPASGLLVSCILLLSLIFTVILTLTGHTEQLKSLEMAALIIMISTVIGCIVALSNDSSQDYKAGQIVGATPWKQQIILLFGTVVSALVMAPILQLLYDAYGFAGALPHANMSISQVLPAPQASMMAAVVNGVFTGQIPWNLVNVGLIIGFFAIILDEVGKRRGFRFPVLGLGIGIYLPSSVTFPIVAGGLLSYIVKLILLKRLGHRHFSQDKETRVRLHRGIITACGVVSGASIMGVLLAIPFAIFKNDSILSIMPDSLHSAAQILGFISFVLLTTWMYRNVLNSKIVDQEPTLNGDA